MLQLKNEPGHSISYKITCAPSENSEQLQNRTVRLAPVSID